MHAPPLFAISNAAMLSALCRRPCVRSRIRRTSFDGQVISKGKDQQVISNFVSRMEDVVNSLILKLQPVTETVLVLYVECKNNLWVSGSETEMDVFGYAYIAGNACVQGLFIRDGKLLVPNPIFQKYLVY